MPFAPIVYYRPRASEAIRRTLFSTAREAVADPVLEAAGAVPRRTYSTRYSARAAINYVVNRPALDDSFTPAAPPDSAGSVPRKLFRTRFDARPALPFLLNHPDPGTTVAVAQADTVGAIPRRMYRSPFRARAALAYAFNRPTMDTSVVVGTQPEAVGSVVRNVRYRIYDARRAAIQLSTSKPGDASVGRVTGANVYVPTYRRRRR